MEDENEDPISFSASLEINEDMFSSIVEEFCSHIDEKLLICEEEKEYNLTLQNEEITMHKVVVQDECDVKSELLLQEESCNKVKISPLMHESKEDIEDDQFWDDLEEFFLTLDVKLTSFVEKNYKPYEDGAKVPILLSNQPHKLVFKYQEEDREETHLHKSNKESSKFVLS